MYQTNQYLEKREMGILSSIASMIFGPDVYCNHGTKGSDGVCMECCNDLFGPDDDDNGPDAEIIDFPKLRDMV